MMKRDTKVSKRKLSIFAAGRGGSKGNSRGIKPPYLLKIHGYLSKPHHYFWDETMEKKRGGREREGEEEEES